MASKRKVCSADNARRLVGVWETRDNDGVERLRERTIYRDGAAAPKLSTGRVRAECDSAGVVIYDYDFAGRVKRTERHVLLDTTTEPEWTDAQPWNGDGMLPASVEHEPLSVEYAFDAQSREIERRTTTGPRNSGVVSRTYDLAGQLDTVSADAPGKGNVSLINLIVYDEKGRRKTVEHGNGCTTEYDYDLLTFRLRTKLLRRGTQALQQWQYVYDPVGNITAIVDALGEDFFYAGTYAPPQRGFTYDGLYRLRTANGREHLSQSQPDQRDVPEWLSLPYSDPSDKAQIVPYTESYEYDLSGNLHTLRHVGAGSWTRTQDAESGSNRLLRTSFDSGEEWLPHYDYRGNLSSLPHLDTMGHNYRDQMISATRTRVGNTRDGALAAKVSNPVHFGYDLRGQRVFKTAVTPTETSTRVYLDGFDLYRERNSGLERETLNISDDQERIALIESRIDQIEQLIRHQHNDHLGSATEERDEFGGPITYEEYHPYGTTAIQLGKPQKRYRFTGQERDEETGLQCHGVRYYATWLTRWTTPDPKGLVDGTNLYAYCRSSPVNYTDATGTDAGDSKSTAEYIALFRAATAAAGQLLSKVAVSVKIVAA